MSQNSVTVDNKKRRTLAKSLSASNLLVALVAMIGDHPRAAELLSFPSFLAERLHVPVECLRRSDFQLHQVMAFIATYRKAAAVRVRGDDGFYTADYLRVRSYIARTSETMTLACKLEEVPVEIAMDELYNSHSHDLTLAMAKAIWEMAAFFKRAEVAK